MNDSQPISSQQAISKLLSGIPVDALDIDLRENRLSTSRTHVQEWSQVAKNIVGALDDAAVKYTVIKALNVPYVWMDDLDLLIERKDDVNEALRILREKGYSLFRDRYSWNPLKITAISEHTNIQVDIYPEPTWFNMRYAQDFLVTSTRGRRKLWGVEAYFPTPTLDLYIVATHAYNHGFISLAEAAHVVNLIAGNQIDWMLMRNLAKTFELSHALIPTLALAQLSLSEDDGQAKISEMIRDLVEGDALSKVYLGWFVKAVLDGFPIRIPLKLRMLSASSRVLRPSLRSQTKVYDELAGYALAFLVRSGKRLAIA